MKIYLLLLSVLLTSTNLWAGRQACLALQNSQGDLIDCRLDLDSIDESMVNHLVDATKLHQFMMANSEQYSKAYQSLLKAGENKAALVDDGRGGVQLVKVTLVSNDKFQGDGSSGAGIGKVVGDKFQDPSGSTGGIISIVGNKFQDPSGSTGGIISDDQIIHLASLPTIPIIAN